MSISSVSSASRTVAEPEMPVWSVTEAPASSRTSAVICASTWDSVNSLEPTVSEAPASSPSPSPPPPSSPPQAARPSASASPPAPSEIFREGVMSSPPSGTGDAGAWWSQSAGSQQVLSDPGQVVDEQREDGGEDGADELDGETVGRQAGDDDVTEPAGVDIGDQGGRADVDDQRGADPGQHHGHRERQLDAAQHGEA